MMRVLNVREGVLVTLSIVSDMAFAWDVINDYTDLMRARIQRDPFCVLKLRATFLKLVSILHTPLVRIHEASSPDLESVSQYYSSELVSYVRSVLQARSTQPSFRAVEPSSPREGCALGCAALRR